MCCGSVQLRKSKASREAPPGCPCLPAALCQCHSRWARVWPCSGVCRGGERGRSGMVGGPKATSVGEQCDCHHSESPPTAQPSEQTWFLPSHLVGPFLTDLNCLAEKLVLPRRRPDPRHHRPLLPGNSFPLHLTHRSSHQLGWVRVSSGVFTAHMQTAELGSSLLQGLFSACSRSTDPSLAADLALSACQTRCPLLLTSALVGPAARAAAGLLCPSLKPPFSCCASGAVGVKRTCLNAGGVTGPLPPSPCPSQQHRDV